MTPSTYVVTQEFKQAVERWLGAQPRGKFTRLEALCDLKLFKLVTLMREVRADEQIAPGHFEEYLAVAVLIGFDDHVAVPQDWQL